MEIREVEVGELRLRVRTAGSGPPLLLLHGFPETSAMWRDLGPRLAESHTVVCPDLPGYGGSDCPEPADDHAPASKRAMAARLAGLMRELGHDRFGVVGHDRGGRVAYRLALDHPQRVERLAVLDIVPVYKAWELADERLALGFWPWSLLAQPAPLPERLIGAAPEAVIDAAMGPEWGTPADTFDDATRAQYLAQLQDPDHLHAICEEYRAGAGIDVEHDRVDVEAGNRIACPVLVLWSEAGPVGTWYAEQGGPLAIWRELADDVRGAGVAGGHFFPEEHPAETAGTLGAFFSPARGS